MSKRVFEIIDLNGAPDLCLNMLRRELCACGYITDGEQVHDITYDVENLKSDWKLHHLKRPSEDERIIG